MKSIQARKWRVKLPCIFKEKNQIFDFKVQKYRGSTALWNGKNTDLVIIFRISNLKKIIEKVQTPYLNFENSNEKQMALSSLSFKKLWLEIFDTIISNWENFINSCIPLRNLKIKYNFQHLNSMTFLVPFQFLQFDGGVYHLFNRGK